MQGHAQVTKPTTEKPTKTIYLWPSTATSSPTAKCPRWIAPLARHSRVLVFGESLWGWLFGEVFAILASRKACLSGGQYSKLVNHLSC